MITIVIMGILAAIAIPSWFSVLESRRVESATNQLTADIRKTGSTASNRLSTWAIVLAPGRAAASAGPDYYTVRLTSSNTVDTSVSPVPRYLPDSVRVVNDASLNDGAAVTAGYGSATGFTQPPSTSRTLKFKSDGSMEVLAAGSGSDKVKVTDDGNPIGEITFFLVTGKVGSRIV